MKKLDHKQNRLYQGTSKITIGNIPVAYKTDTDENDINSPPEETINGLITSFTVPGVELEYDTHSHYNAIVHIPVSEQNAYKGKVLAVNMILDSRQENYWTLWRYMETIRSGSMDGYPIEDINNRVFGHDKKYRNRLMYIPRIDIITGTNYLQTQQRMIFHRCFPLILSELPTTFTEQAPATFTISFLFSNLTIERQKPHEEENVEPKDVIDG